MPDLSEVSAIVGTLAVVSGGVTWSVRRVLKGFHAEHIGPAISELSHTIKAATTATSNLTDRMEKSDEASKEHQTENRKTFDRLGVIISDHETRISVIEAAKPSKSLPRRRE